jgi:hypothetical protein
MRSDLGLWSYWMTLNDGPSPQSVGKMWARLRYESDHGPRYRRLHKGSRSVRRQIPCAAIFHPRCEARVEPHTMGSGFRLGTPASMWPIDDRGPSAISGSNWLRGRQGIVRSIRAITGVRPKASLADARPLRLRDCDRISELMCQKCPFSGLQERLVWVEGLVVVKRTHRERTSQCRTPYSPLRKPAGSSDSPQEPWHSSGTPAVVLASSN